MIETLLLKARSRRDLLALCIVTTALFMVFTMSAPLIPLLVTAMTGSPGMVGIVISISAIGSLFAAIPAGTLIARFGVRRPMTLTALGLSLCSVSLYVFPSLGYLFVGLALYEIGKIIIIVALQSHVGAMGEKHEASLNFGWYGAAAAAGQMIGPVLAGLIIDRYGYLPGWLAMAVAMIGALLLILLLIRDEERVATGPEAVLPTGSERLAPGEAVSAADAVVPPSAPDLQPVPPAGIRSPSGIRSIFGPGSFIAILASFLVLFAMGTRTSFYPIYLQELGFSATLIGSMLSLRAMVSISTRLGMRWIIRKAGGDTPALLGALFLLAAAIGTTPLCRDIVSLSINSIAVGLGIGLSLPISMAIVSGGVTPERRSIAMGVRLTGNRLAQIINPLFFGLIAEWRSIVSAFFAGGLLLFLSTLPILSWWRRERRRAPGQTQ